MLQDKLQSSWQERVPLSGKQQTLDLKVWVLYIPSEKLVEACSGQNDGIRAVNWQTKC